MRIGELAARAGVSTSKIRFYEGRGLLPATARSLSGYRDYDEQALLILRFIVRAQKLGFSLADVGGHLSLPHGTDRKASLQAGLETKLTEIDAHMEAIRARRTVIVGLIKEVRDLRDA